MTGTARRCGSALALALLASAVVAGCGGSQQPYGAAATRACLAKTGATFRQLGPSVDFVATTASGGAVGAKLGANTVTIAFGADGDEAARIERAYRRFGPRSYKPPLEAIRNVVLVWAVPPSDQDSATVKDCLK